MVESIAATLHTRRLRVIVPSMDGPNRDTVVNHPWWATFRSLNAETRTIGIDDIQANAGAARVHRVIPTLFSSNQLPISMALANRPARTARESSVH